jgi:hypothetical protein
MAQSQRETCVEQIHKMYEGLEQMQANSEQFFYRYANFIDATFTKVYLNEQRFNLLQF